jgi:hypothetical protein
MLICKCFSERKADDEGYGDWFVRMALEGG